MKAIVVAAGEGSRLAPYSDIIPKIMFPIGRQPLGRYIVESLVKGNFKDIIFCVSEQWYPLIEDYFVNGERFGAKIEYSISDKPLGTAGEVRNATTYGLFEGDFLLYYGDILTEIDLGGLWQNYFEHGLEPGYMGTLAIQDKINTEVGLTGIENGNITSFVEKVQLSHYNWSAIAILKRETLNYITPQKNDFATHIFPEIIKGGFKLKAYINKNAWCDVGNLQSYKKVREIYNANTKKNI